MQRAANEPREPDGAKRRRARQGHPTAKESCWAGQRGEAEAVAHIIIPPRYADAAVQPYSAVGTVSRGECNF